MEISSDLVAAARKGKRDAVIELLALHYPTVWQMAVALTGRADVGRGVARHMMRLAPRAAPTWRDHIEPTRWFYHHSVLTIRRTVKHAPDPQNDPLFGSDGASVPAYVAFIRAIRELPIQQREAFILTHGQKLEFRTLATAMDCSTVAATTHLNAASDRLRAMAGSDYDSHVARLGRVYQTLGPSEDLSVQEIHNQVRRSVGPWFFVRKLKVAFSIILLGITAWLIYWIYQVAMHSM